MKMEELENTAENIKDEIKDTTKEIGNKIENNLDNIQNIPNQIQNMDFSQDNFLFFFKINTEEETMCGLSQSMTVKIISIFALLFAISFFIDTLNGDFFFDGFYKLILCILYLVIAFYSFYSTINQNDNYAKIGYLISAILWIYYFILFLFDFLFDLFKFINIFGDDFLKIKELFHDVGQCCLLLIFLYFVYILYCYQVNLKNGRSV